MRNNYRLQPKFTPRFNLDNPMKSITPLMRKPVFFEDPNSGPKQNALRPNEGIFSWFKTKKKDYEKGLRKRITCRTPGIFETTYRRVTVSVPLYFSLLCGC